MAFCTLFWQPSTDHGLCSAIRKCALEGRKVRVCNCGVVAMLLGECWCAEKFCVTKRVRGPHEPHARHMGCHAAAAVEPPYRHGSTPTGYRSW